MRIALAVLLCAFALSSSSLAASKHVSLPKQITDAKTVAVIARLGEVGPGGYTPDPRRAKEQVCDAIEKWGRYSVVDDPKQADLVLVITEGHNGNVLISNSNGASSITQPVSILGDVLAVYPGGSVPDDRTEPLWFQIERGGYSWPAKRAIAKFKKNVEAASAQKDGK